MKAAGLALIAAVLSWVPPTPAQAMPDRVDIALVLAVDVSGSVDDSRFALQMEGIASAFEDQDVQNTILSGRNRALLVTLVNWSNKPQVAIPWTVIASPADALAFAAAVRQAPRISEEFTCMSLMMQTVGEKILPLMPLPADRMVVDVSGDGHDNCNPRTAVDSVRDSLIDSDVTINGLPIREGREADTIALWYEEHVIGGVAAFLLPANGYQDFGRAIRQKFIIEISGHDTRQHGLSLAHQLTLRGPRLPASFPARSVP